MNDEGMSAWFYVAVTAAAIIAFTIFFYSLLGPQPREGVRIGWMPVHSPVEKVEDLSWLPESPMYVDSTYVLCAYWYKDGEMIFQNDIPECPKEEGVREEHIELKFPGANQDIET